MMPLILHICICLAWCSTSANGFDDGLKLVCGRSNYDPSGFFCCNEQLHRYPRPEDAKNMDNDCCNGALYNSFTHLCCEGHLFVRNETSLECCGRSVYNWETHICCGGVVGRKECRVLCCGGKFYSLETHVCCSDVIWRRTPGMRCCGSSLFNTSTEICCGSCVHRKDKTRSSCCGNMVIDFTTHRCCSFRDKFEVFNPQTHICCNGAQRKIFGDNTRCCFYFMGDPNRTIYDFRTARCCKGEVVVSEGGKPLSLNTFCCSNLLYELDAYTGCCVQVLYNPRTHKCCHSLRGSVNLRQRNHKCCSSAYYDTTKAVCCWDKVVYTKGLNDPVCCGGKLFQKPGACCQNRWHSGVFRGCCGSHAMKVGHQCCAHNFRTDGTPYNPRRQACCNLRVVEARKLPRNKTYSCCGSTPYVYSDSLCCCGCVHKRDDVNSCCGKRAFNSKSHLCCLAKIYPLEIFNACCSSRVPYNSNTHKCCYPGIVIPKQQSC